MAVASTVLTVSTATYSTSSDTNVQRKSAGLTDSVHPSRETAAAKSGRRTTGKSGEPGKHPRPVAPPAAQAHSLIFIGTATLRVPKVDYAAITVNRLTTRAGGFISDDKRAGDKAHYWAKVTLKVPSSQFSSVLSGLAALGTPVSRQQSAQDVTNEVVNLNARIRIGRTGVDRLRALLRQAKNVRDIVSLEPELSRRQAAVESLKLRRSELHSLIAFSTITVELLQKSAPKRIEHVKTGFRAGLVASWHAITASATVLVTVIGATLPWLLALAILMSVALLIMRQAWRTRGRTSSDTETK